MTATAFLFFLGWVIVFLILFALLRHFGREDERRRDIPD